jgi:4-hydroxy-2-oxoheptanedioate aldolase
MARGIPIADYVAFMKENLFVMVQIESPQAVANAEAIAAIDGVDMLVVGPYDLSGSMGIPNQFENPEHRKLVDAAVAGAKRAGKPIATVPHGPHDAASLFARGFRFVIASTDFGLMRRAAVQEIAAIEKARG